MSHLLYLHSFAVDRFVSVFGGGDTAHVDALLKKVNPRTIKLAPADAKQVVTDAVTYGIDWSSASPEEKVLLGAIVQAAVTTKSFGIGAEPISANGVGGELFDEFEGRFVDGGSTSTKLFEILQTGRNYEGGSVLLSPDDVVKGKKILKRIAKRLDPDEEGELDEEFIEELVEPFKESAKKNHAVFGHWT